MRAATRWECKPLNSHIALMEFQCFHGPPTNWNFLLLWMPHHLGPFLNHSPLLFPTLACFSASGSPTLIHTHSHPNHILSSRTEQSTFQKPTEVFYAGFSSALKMLTRGKSKILHPKSPCFWEGRRRPAALCQPLYDLSLTDQYQTK